MIPFAWLCLLVSPATLDLVDETYQVPANEWRYVEVSLRQQPALLSAELDWQAGSREIRAALLRRQDLERLRRDHPYGVLAATSPDASGRFQFYVQDPGDYAVVLDNRDSDQPATVRLRVWLDFAGPPGYAGQSLSPQRRLGVILVSFALFFGIVTWSARRLLQVGRASWPAFFRNPR
jgi:hypothetical protein